MMEAFPLPFSILSFFPFSVSIQINHVLILIYVLRGVGFAHLDSSKQSDLLSL